MGNLQTLIAEIEVAIKGMDIDPEQARGEEPGQWMLVSDFTPVFIDAWEENESTPWNYFVFESDKTVFQLIVPAYYAPTIQREAFLEELLTVNLNLHYTRFSYNPKENLVVLSMRMPGSGFNKEKLKGYIDALNYYAEMTFHVLKDEFKLKKALIE